MRVGRDVHDRLKSRVQSGLKLAAGERIELIVRLNGRKPAADCLVVTNARVVTLASTVEPLYWIRRQALADEVRTWRLSRKFRSRLTVTSGYGRTDVFGSSLAVYDDDLVDEQMAALVSSRDDTRICAIIKALRAEAHWVSGGYGRAMYVLDRAKIPHATAQAIDLDMVERQLSQFDYWPSSEVRRHLAACLPAGGCHFARAEPFAQATTARVSMVMEHIDTVSQALVTVDATKIKKAGGLEGDIVDQLMAVVAHIRAAPAWGMSHLDDNDLRIDIHDEVRQIALACHRIAGLRAEMGDKPEGQSETGRQAADLHDTSALSLDALTRRLADRVGVLVSYRDRLRALSREMADLDKAARIEGVAEKVANLVASAAGDDPGDALAGLLPHPRGASDAVPSATAALREEAERLRHHDGAPLLASAGNLDRHP